MNAPITMEPIDIGIVFTDGKKNSPAIIVIIAKKNIADARS